MGIRKYVRWLFSPATGLSNRAIHGGIWSFALNASNRIVQLVKTVVLANLLTPDAFGLVGIAIITFELSHKLTNIGFDQALVQRKETNVDRYIDTTWVVQAVRGVGLFVVLTLAAPLIARLFADPRLTDVIRVFAVIAIVDGLINPAIIYFQKELEFHKEFLYRTSSTVANVTVATLFALVYGTYWALVVGVVVGQLIELFMSFVVADYRPTFRFHRDLAEDLLEFGKWVYTSTLTIYIAQKGDDAFVGWLLGSSPLGLYQVSFRFGNAPATEIANVISSVSFPLYSKLQDDRAALRGVFERITEIVFIVTFPATVGIVLVAPAFTRVVLGEQWTPMVTTLQILTVGGFARTITQTGRPLFRGYGVPELDFWMNVLRLVVIVVTIWPLTVTFGIEGASVSVSLGLFAMLPVWFWYTRRITRTALGHYVRVVAIPSIGSAFMAFPVFIVRNPTLERFLAAIAVGVIVYISFTYVIYRLIGRRPVDEIRSYLENLG